MFVQPWRILGFRCRRWYSSTLSLSAGADTGFSQVVWGGAGVLGNSRAKRAILFFTKNQLLRWFCCILNVFKATLAIIQLKSASLAPPSELQSGPWRPAPPWIRLSARDNLIFIKAFHVYQGLLSTPDPDLIAPVWNWPPPLSEKILHAPVSFFKESCSTIRPSQSFERTVFTIIGL